MADTYAISDNYHQFQLGGTGPNSITTGTADPLVYTNAKAQQAAPPVLQVEDPNPYPGSNNWYLKEGFYLFDAGNQSYAENLSRTASAAAWVHGRAALLAGPGMLAEDLPKLLPRAIAEAQ